MFQERRLGRGLEALLGRPAEAQAAASSPTAVSPQPVEGAADAIVHPESGFVSVSVQRVDRNPQQPRVEFDDAEIQRLADSIIEHGLLQPVVVRRVGDRFELIAGERRLQAVRKAGFDNITVQIVEADERQQAEKAIVENLHRKDLNALEKARCFQDYLQRYSCTQEELATRLQLDRSTVSNFIRLLELPEGVQQLLREGKITQGHARALLSLGDEPEQVALARRISEETISVRATEALVQEMIRSADREPLAVFVGNEGGDDAPAPESRTREDNLAFLEADFRRVLGTKVDVKQTKSGSGKIVIHFKGAEEFERLRTQLQSTAGAPRDASTEGADGEGEAA